MTVTHQALNLQQNSGALWMQAQPLLSHLIIVQEFHLHCGSVHHRNKLVE